MIQLHKDYLLFETSQGQVIPCSAEMVAVEFIGDAAASLDPSLVQEAAAAVLHYFKEDLGWTTVSVGEFSKALSEALRSLGLRIESEESAAGGSVLSCDLRRLVSGSERSLELSFFPSLREELRACLEKSPSVLRFHGLRDCVKALVGARRWCGKCEMLSDQIVEFLRACLETERAFGSCGLIVR